MSVEFSSLVHVREKLLRKLILEAINSKPTGVLGLTLWNRLRKHTYGFTVQEFDGMLTSLRTLRIIVCTNKRWWVTDYTKNHWQEALDEDHHIQSA